jgi:hypothetical protein
MCQVVIMTPRRSKKRSAAGPPTSSKPLSGKKAKLTGASALEGLTISLGKFGDAIAKALAPLPSDAVVNSARCQDAIIRAQILEKQLSMPELLSFINLLKKDADAIAVYLTLEDKEFRKEWVQNKVNSLPLII